MKSVLPFLLLLTLLLTGCGGETSPGLTVPPPPLPTVTGAPVGSASPIAPAPTLLPPVVPVTLTPLPTQTTPAVVEPIASSTPAVDVIELLSGDDFGSDRNPLTGEVMADPSRLERRPIAAKISNAPAQFVRPQSGLNLADLVFEHLSEGNLTRFTAIFYGETPPDVGPIRSARLIDIELPAMYNAALAFSGSSIGVSQKIRGSDFATRVLYANEPGYYRTGANKPYEHTLYADPTGWWNALTTKGLNQAPDFTTYMAFRNIPPGGGQPASAVSVDYRQTVSAWTYDATDNVYLRVADGVPLVDANTGEQVRARNVVVVYANHQTDFNICETQLADRCQDYSIEIQIWGEGPARIFRDGQVFEATWRRLGRTDMLTFVDGAGNPMPLQIGNTWFQMVPMDFGPRVTVTP